MSNSSELIRKVRFGKDITIRTVADTIPISCDRLLEIERGNSKLDVVNMLRIAEILFAGNETALYDAFAKDNDTLPIDIMHYILDNDLQKALRILKENDPSGQTLIELAMKFSDEKTR